MITEILFIEEKYDDFHTFYNSSKEMIYHKFIEAFENKTNRDGKTLLDIIVNNVDGRPFQSKFLIERSKPNILIETIKPFFESIEDYETCEKIVHLHHQLLNQKN